MGVFGRVFARSQKISPFFRGNLIYSIILIIKYLHCYFVICYSLFVGYFYD